MKMKKVWTFILAFVTVCCLLSLSIIFAGADTATGTCGDNLTWSFNDSTGTLTISGTGAMTNYSASAPWYPYRTSIKKVVLPQGITSLSRFAFSDCSVLTEITIPNSVTSIGEHGFYKCTALTEITIPEGVTIIDWDTFSGCTGLTKVSIPNGVTKICDYAFYGCVNLTEITIPDSVTSIGSVAFKGCAGLTEVVIPNSVTSLGSSCFSMCTGLTKISIGRGVASKVDSAFSGCTGLAKIEVDAGNTVYHSANNCLIETASKTLILGCKNSTIPTDGSVTTIGQNAFNGCTGLTEITIPNSVTSIGSGAFRGCTGLTEISIPGSVATIGRDAFSCCHSLIEVYISNGLTSIESSAFASCTGLTEITIPSSVTSIGKYVFISCANLTKIEIASGNPVYHSANNCIIETATKTLVLGCKSSVVPGDGSVSSIGSDAFVECSGLTEVTIPESVSSIGEQAFMGCRGLIEVVIENGVTSIGQCAFTYCTGLTEIIIPNSITSIGDYAFDGCTNLKTVYNFSALPIAKGSTNNGCVGYYADTVHSGGSCGENLQYIFDDATGTLIISGAGAMANYSNNGSPWYYYRTSIKKAVFSQGVTSIGDNAFFECTGLTEISIPNSVTSIGDTAFFNCIGLTEITLPNSITYIDGYAFCQCASLTKITVPETVTFIGSDAFYACPNLTLEVDYGSCAYEYALVENIPYRIRLKFSGASLTLYDDISVNYVVDKVLFTEVGYTNPYVVFEFNGRKITVSEYTEKDNYYRFSFENVAPDKMNDTIQATLYATLDGTVYSSVTKEYSIATYCYDSLKDHSSEEYSALRTLLVDLLNYGAASQQYTGHNVENLANAALTEEQKAFASGDILTFQNVLDTKFITVENPSVTWGGAGLELDNSITMKFLIRAESVDGLTLKITDENDNEWTVPGSEFKKQDDGYFIRFNGLNVSQMKETIYLTVYNGDTPVSNTVRYSIESYVYTAKDSPDQNLATLVREMMKYGNSAKTYKETGVK